MTRKICIVTGSRAEYGLLRWVIQGVNDDPDLTLQLIVTGMHLSPEFGLTIKEIERDGFCVDHKVEMLLSSDTPVGVVKSMGVGMIGFADVLENLKPDLLLVLGDRFEVLSVATSAVILNIPIAHLHGGELSEGAIDDAFRHSTSKLSHLHFTATEEYRRRVIQLGESPERVFNVGAPGLENIRRLSLLNREELEHAIGLKLGSRNLLVTYHPETLSPEKNHGGLMALLSALDDLTEVKLIFTKSNADADGRMINQVIDDYVGSNPGKAVVHSSLGQRVYLSVIKYVDGVVGNSSSGIIEAPSFQKGTINIGDRQSGRVRADSVIDCHATYESITEALDTLFSPEFCARLNNVKNPYGSGCVADKIINQVKCYPLGNLLKKKFFDYPLMDNSE